MVKPLQGGELAVALFNASGTAKRAHVTRAELGLESARTYRARDLWQHTDASMSDSLTLDLPAHATALYRIGVAP